MKNSLLMCLAGLQIKSAFLILNRHWCQTVGSTYFCSFTKEDESVAACGSSRARRHGCARVDTNDCKLSTPHLIRGNQKLRITKSLKLKKKNASKWRQHEEIIFLLRIIQPCCSCTFPQPISIKSILRNLGSELMTLRNLKKPKSQGRVRNIYSLPY